MQLEIEPTQVLSDYISFDSAFTSFSLNEILLSRQLLWDGPEEGEVGYYFSCQTGK